MKLIADGTFGTFFSAMATMYGSVAARNLFITYESIIHAMFGCRKVKRMRKRKRLNENGPYSTVDSEVPNKRTTGLRYFQKPDQKLNSSSVTKKHVPS